VSVIELRASNWGRNETDRTVGAGDSMNGRASVTNYRVILVVVVTANKADNVQCPLDLVYNTSQSHATWVGSWCIG